jgi:hypothetical protein
MYILAAQAPDCVVTAGGGHRHHDVVVARMPYGSTTCLLQDSVVASTLRDLFLHLRVCSTSEQVSSMVARVQRFNLHCALA